MKTKYGSILLAIFVLSIQCLYSQSLTVIEQDYDKAKIEAKKQNKLLLIDFYTTWCSPCKEIDREIFQNKLVSDEVAKSFVVLRYDAEKEEINKLSLKHYVGWYPTTIILNQDQFVVMKHFPFGGKPQDLVKNYQAFLNEGILANSTNTYIKGISNTTDLVYPKFYEDYVFGKNTKLDEAELRKFWNSTEDRFSEVAFAVLAYFQEDDEINSFFLKNRKKYEEFYGRTDVKMKKDLIIAIKFAAAIGSKNRALFDSTVLLTREIEEKSEADKIIKRQELKMLMAENRWSEALKLFTELKISGGKTDDEINSFCRSAMEKCRDNSILKQCAEWMKNITDKKPTFDFLDTYARLLYKFGKKKESKNTMAKAIQIGKANKEDIKDSEDWVKNHK